ncbi:hypothetical protein BaRGS_00002255 [Batillaria attramentaria]|uniref:Uncharacterized protein n=1 Tax=Batillaria attramentaria TaxID=370345 RepID=A0ABD0M4D5_9CAEN
MSRTTSKHKQAHYTAPQFRGPGDLGHHDLTPPYHRREMRGTSILVGGFDWHLNKCNAQVYRSREACTLLMQLSSAAASITSPPLRCFLREDVCLLLLVFV